MRLLTALILTGLVTFPQESWRLEKDRDGIRVYTRKVEGYQVKEFRVESQTPATLPRIEELFRDIGKYTEWMPDISEVTLLEKVSPDLYIYHMIIGAPFPVSDRDLVTEMRFIYPEKNILRIEYNVLPDHIPESDDHVRMRYFHGHWQFERQADKTIITNRFMSDPGGSVPGWLTNSFIARNPLETVTNLKAQIE